MRLRGNGSRAGRSTQQQDEHAAGDGGEPEETNRPRIELLELAQGMGVKMWPCQMTMDLMGLKDEDLIDGLPDPAGA